MGFLCFSDFSGFLWGLFFRFFCYFHGVFFIFVFLGLLVSGFVVCDTALDRRSVQVDPVMYRSNMLSSGVAVMWSSTEAENM
jgi:hypothetical protein